MIAKIVVLLGFFLANCIALKYDPTSSNSDLSNQKFSQSLSNGNLLKQVKQRQPGGEVDRDIQIAKGVFTGIGSAVDVISSVRDAVLPHLINGAVQLAKGSNKQAPQVGNEAVFDEDQEPVRPQRRRRRTTTLPPLLPFKQSYHYPSKHQPNSNTFYVPRGQQHQGNAPIQNQRPLVANSLINQNGFLSQLTNVIKPEEMDLHLSHMDLNPTQRPYLNPPQYSTFNQNFINPTQRPNLSSPQYSNFNQNLISSFPTEAAIEPEQHQHYKFGSVHLSLFPPQQKSEVKTTSTSTSTSNPFNYEKDNDIIIPNFVWKPAYKKA